EQDIPLRLRIQVRSFEAICRMIHTGMGVGILPAQVVRNYLPALDVATVPLAEAWASRELKIGVRDPDALSVTARQLRAHLAQHEGQGRRPGKREMHASFAAGEAMLGEITMTTGERTRLQSVYHVA